MRTMSTLFTPREPTMGIAVSRHVGIACLIVAESAVFIIFVVAYIFYLGKSISGPSPRELIEVPIFGTICPLSSSLTVYFVVAALRKNQVRLCSLWLAATVLLGSIFWRTRRETGISSSIKLDLPYARICLAPLLLAGGSARDARQRRTSHAYSCAGVWTARPDARKTRGTP